MRAARMRDARGRYAATHRLRWPLNAALTDRNSSSKESSTYLGIGIGRRWLPGSSGLSRGFAAAAAATSCSSVVGTPAAILARIFMLGSVKRPMVRAGGGGGQERFGALGDAPC